MCLSQPLVSGILLFFICAFAGECLMCPAGHFCDSEGLVEPSGPCAAGFLCLIGATVPNPTDNMTGSPCPPGAYCQLGIKAGQLEYERQSMWFDTNVFYCGASWSPCYISPLKWKFLFLMIISHKPSMAPIVQWMFVLVFCAELCNG